MPLHARDHRAVLSRASPAERCHPAECADAPGITGVSAQRSETSDRQWVPWPAGHSRAARTRRVGVLERRGQRPAGLGGRSRPGTGHRCGRSRRCAIRPGGRRGCPPGARPPAACAEGPCRDGGGAVVGGPGRLPRRGVLHAEQCTEVLADPGVLQQRAGDQGGAVAERDQLGALAQRLDSRHHVGVHVRALQGAHDPFDGLPRG